VLAVPIGSPARLIPVRLALGTADHAPLVVGLAGKLSPRHRRGRRPPNPPGSRKSDRRLSLAAVPFLAKPTSRASWASFPGTERHFRDPCGRPAGLSLAPRQSRQSRSSSFYAVPIPQLNCPNCLVRAGTGKNSKRPRGRPALPAESVKRHALGIRTTKALKDALLRASQESGRSLAQEIEFRLEWSLADQRRLGGPRACVWPAGGGAHADDGFRP
jgi:hypothetical protein